MTNIAHSGGVIVPTIVDGYEATRPLRTIVHPVLNRSNPEITLRAPGLRSGSLRCVFATMTDAQAAYAVFSIPQVLTLTDAAVPAVGMAFVAADGDLTLTLDDVTRNTWIITVPFTEVLP